MPELTLAVRASVAIPGLFAPVVIDGRRYVDAGPYSVSNLDLVADEPVDAVLCINPLSRAAPEPGFANGRGSGWERALDRIVGVVGQRIANRLAHESRRVEARGIPVFVLHPTEADRTIMPRNSMSMASRASVVRMAAGSVERTLRQEARFEPLVDLLRRAAVAECAPSAAS